MGKKIATDKRTATDRRVKTERPESVANWAAERSEANKRRAMSSRNSAGVVAIRADDGRGKCPRPTEAVDSGENDRAHRHKERSEA
jgi:hypothetical protein